MKYSQAIDLINSESGEDMNRKMVIFAVLLGALFIIPMGTAMAETPQEKGWQIKKAIDELPVVEKMTNEVAFRIYDAQGKLLFTKKSRAAIFTENYNDAENRLDRNISYFFAPADDKGNSALMIEYPGDKEDDQWVYLKGLRKPKRIIGSDKGSSFMGSDFSNGDVSPIDIDDSRYTWLGTEAPAATDTGANVEKSAGSSGAAGVSGLSVNIGGYLKTLGYWSQERYSDTFWQEMYRNLPARPADQELSGYTNVGTRLQAEVKYSF